MKVELDPRMTTKKAAPPCCINCKYVRLERIVNPNNIKCKKYKSIDLIKGDVFYQSADEIRQDENKCGLTGREYEPQNIMDKTRVNVEKVYCTMPSESFAIFVFMTIIFTILKFGLRATPPT